MNDYNDIYEYTEECYFEPERNWPRDQVIKRCSERWALKELLDRIAKSDAGSINVAMDFIEELKRCEEVDNPMSYRFTYAKNVIEEVAILLTKQAL